MTMGGRRVKQLVAGVAVAAILAAVFLWWSGSSADGSRSNDIQQPQGVAPRQDSPTVEVRTFDFLLRYKLTGEVQEDDSARVKAPDGSEFKPRVKAGEQVERGAVVGSYGPSGDELVAATRSLEDASRDVEVLERVDATARANGEPGPSQAEYDAAVIARDRAYEDLNTLTSKAGELVAPRAGVAKPDGSGVTIEGSGLVVVAPLKPVQALRLSGVETTGRAVVETPTGQRGVKCESLAVGVEKAAPVSADDGEESADGETQVGGRCVLPEGTVTVAGLPAKLQVESTELAGAIVVPQDAIGVDTETNISFVIEVSPGGDRRKVEVEPGPTNGVVQVIESGPKPGTKVLARPSEDS